MKESTLQEVLNKVLVVFVVLFLLVQCTAKKKEKMEEKISVKSEKGTFGYDVAFLSQHQQVITLQDEKGRARLLICPGYQGRVMTSTADGDKGMSFGWINYDLIASGKLQQHINPYGGEDRFWIGPEGGQFSVFFKPGTRFVMDDWFTPGDIDTVAYDVVESDSHHAVFTHQAHMQNYSGHDFYFRMDRKIKLLDGNEISEILGVAPGSGVLSVGYKSLNRITNTGNESWTRKTGAVSIWILGMFTPSPAATIVVPFKTGDEVMPGPVVNDKYFGAIPDDRLKIEDGVVFLKADGKYRSKIGLRPSRALPFAGSYDEEHQALTIVHYTVPDGVTEYVNSMWEIQEDPFGGDLVNAYNDGPVNGKALGPFYELESSSPAAFLKPGESMDHLHVTMHFTGPKKELDKISKAVLGVSIEKIAKAF